MTTILRLGCLGVLAGALLPAARSQEAPVNLALGRPYTMTAPNYALCKDADDAIQLTDGQRTEGHFWTRPSTVGWSGGKTVTLTIDLGADHPIDGVVFSTAGGVSDVLWPLSLVVLVSPDGQAWYEAGDLVAQALLEDPPPAYGTYATYAYRAGGLGTHGRHVCIVAEPGDQYLFCDEIEVIAGAPELLARPYAGPALPDSPDRAGLIRGHRLLVSQLARDLQAVRADLAAAPPPDAAGLTARADALAQRLRQLPRLPLDNFRAVLPMNDLERDIFALQAAVWRAQGKAPLRLWQGQRWDPLEPSEEPPAAATAPRLDVALMQNEWRADVLNITNAAAADGLVTLTLDGLPEAPAGGWLEVHEVQHVGTRRFTSVAAALPAAERVGSSWRVRVPAGMTRQVWFSVHAVGIEPGRYEGAVVAAGADTPPQRVPFHVHVSRLRFPERTTMNLGGWSYTNHIGAGGITAANRDALVAALKEHHVNAPWATSSVLPRGRMDDQGTFLEEPDTSAFDAFVDLWTEARYYMVYVAIGDWSRLSSGFDGAPRGTPAFTAKLAAWAHFWAGHLRRRGMAPRQLGLLIIDEPHNEAMYEALLAYARVIKDAEPEITLFIDPQPGDPESCLPMLRSMDVIVPHRPQWLQSKEWFPALFESLRQEGRQLGLYSADGPARSFDPYAYYLLQHWHCFAIGGTWSGFWSFGGDSRFSVWNEYASDGRGSYCPMYLDDEGVTPGKGMEAVREGVQDYEYLVMLRQAVEAAPAPRRNGDAWKDASRLLGEACARVLADSKGRDYRWDVPRDRSVAEAVRREVLAALEALAEP